MLCSCAIVEYIILIYQNKGNACIYDLFSINFSVPLWSKAYMMDHILLRNSPFISILILNTP